MRQGLWKPLDYLFLLRPTILLPVWAFLLIGFHRAKISGLSDFRVVWEVPPHLIRGLWVYSLLLGAIYVLNQIYDVETDRKNRKLFLLADGYIQIRSAWLYTAFLLLLSYASLRLFFPNRPSLRVLWFLSLGMGILYNVPPWKFKGRPYLDLLSNAVGYGGLNVLFGMALRGSPPLSTALFETLPYVLAVGAVFLLTTLPDIPGDRAAGDRTTGVALGAKKTALLAFIWLLLAGITAFFARDPLVFYPSWVSLPLYARALRSPTDETAKLAYRLSAGIFALFLALKIPLYLGLGLLTFLALKLYYRWRFHLDYPSLKGR